MGNRAKKSWNGSGNAALMRAMFRCYMRYASAGASLLLALQVAPAPRSMAAEVGPASGLQNLRKVSQGVWSGGAPMSGEDFRRLSRLGVKTVVSVDGARPDLESARKAGLRYVHVPIGYDGIGPEAQLSLVRLAAESTAPLYIHCHHGRHRAPAAAAIVCLSGGGMERAEALAYMKAAGTSRDYTGLWRDVEKFRRPDAEVRLPELVEVAKVDSLTAAMAGIDRAWDRLEALRRNDWQPPVRHPDVVPSREALMLREGFHESIRALGEGVDVDMMTGLRQAEQRAEQLRRALADQKLERAGKLRERLKRSCADCHRRHRN